MVMILLKFVMVEVNLPLNEIGDIDIGDWCLSDDMLDLRRFGLVGKLQLNLLWKAKSSKVVEQGHEGVGDTEVETEVRISTQPLFHLALSYFQTDKSFERKFKILSQVLLTSTFFKFEFWSQVLLASLNLAHLIPLFVLNG